MLKDLSALSVAIKELPLGIDVPVRNVGCCAVYVDGPTHPTQILLSRFA